MWVILFLSFSQSNDYCPLNLWLDASWKFINSFEFIMNLRFPPTKKRDSYISFFFYLSQVKLAWVIDMLPELGEVYFSTELMTLESYHNPYKLFDYKVPNSNLKASPLNSRKFPLSLRDNQILPSLNLHKNWIQKCCPPSFWQFLSGYLSIRRDYNLAPAQR